jgi:hypothetical protein
MSVCFGLNSAGCLVRSRWGGAIFVLVIFCFVITPAFGACHVVTPTGSGSNTGADWNNALPSLPSTLTRGDIYYLADGTYPAYTFTTATSGTLTLEIRKAQTYDHCTATGWSPSTMGSSQAVFYGSATPLIGIDTSYVTVNGNGGLAAPGCGAAPGSSFTSEPAMPSDCGIRVDNTGCTNVTQDACDRPIFVEGPFTNYTVEYVELVGNGNNQSDEMEFEAPYGGAGPSTIFHVYGRNAGCVYLQYGANYRTVSFSYFWGTEVNGATGSNPCHGQAEFYSPPDSNYTNPDNVYRDITGSAIWTWAQPSTGTANNLVYYNDVVFNSSTFTKPDGTLKLYLGTIADGVLGCFNTSINCTNVVFVQNTIVNEGWACGIDNANTGSYTVENNIWYGCYDSNGNPGGIAFLPGTGGIFTQQYNSFLAAGSSCPSGAGNVCVTSSPNPFVSWATSNFNLVSESPDWNNRLPLGIPYTTDPNGNARTTDRGAYQFGSTGCSVTSTSIGPYTAGQLVSVQFTAANCSTSTFTISSGSLSGSGLTLGSGGLLSGTAVAGSFSFTVAYGTAMDPISLTINAAPSITTISLSVGQVGTPYAQTLNTSGGSGAIACAVTSGALPTGLALIGCTISGTPTAASGYSFSVSPTDSNGVVGNARALSILINLPSSSTPLILHTTFCGPGLTWPGTCALSAPTTAGSRLVVAYSSYNSAGSTPVMNSITDGVDTFSQLANARSINTNSTTSWNDIWSAGGVAGGVTTLTVTPSTAQTGDVYVWELQYAPNVMGCASLSSQAAATPAVGASMLAGAGAILLSHLHPAPGGNPTAVSSPFTIDTISDQMAYAQFTPSSAGTLGPQWTQTATTFATATCGFSATGSGPTPPSPLTTTSQ